MKHLLTYIILITGLVFTIPVTSGTAANDLGNCMIDSLNGKERKLLAKWVFFAMAAHPEINSYSNISNKDRKEVDEAFGNLTTRLFTSDCGNELRIAYKTDSTALQKAFELVGQVAMQEIMTNRNVKSAIVNYAQYVDQEKINSLILEK